MSIHTENPLSPQKPEPWSQGGSSLLSEYQPTTDLGLTLPRPDPLGIAEMKTILENRAGGKVSDASAEDTIARLMRIIHYLQASNLCFDTDSTPESRTMIES